MDEVVFRETQRMPPSWRAPVLAIAGGGALLYVWSASLAGGAGAATLIGLVAVVAGLAVASLAIVARLEVSVTGASVDVRWVPLARRSIPFASIRQAEPVTYRPIRQFGGWGIRFGRRGARAYSMSGDRAVRLTLHDGSEIYLGSLEPEALAAAIDRARVR